MIITLDFMAFVVTIQQNQDTTLYSSPNKTQGPLQSFHSHLYEYNKQKVFHQI
jgi:hypothetical protein